MYLHSQHCSLLNQNVMLVRKVSIPTESCMNELTSVQDVAEKEPRQRGQNNKITVWIAHHLSGHPVWLISAGAMALGIAQVLP